MFLPLSALNLVFRFLLLTFLLCSKLDVFVVPIRSPFGYHQVVNMDHLQFLPQIPLFLGGSVTMKSSTTSKVCPVFDVWSVEKELFLLGLDVSPYPNSGGILLWLRLWSLSLPYALGGSCDSFFYINLFLILGLWTVLFLLFSTQEKKQVTF